MLLSLGLIYKNVMNQLGIGLGTGWESTGSMDSAQPAGDSPSLDSQGHPPLGTVGDLSQAAIGVLQFSQNALDHLIWL